MASPHEQAFERLQGAVVDGRTENIRFRQNQLQSLHKTLREEASAVCSALAQNPLSSTTEVEAEFSLAMDSVRHCYDSLDLDQELEEEYKIANGKDNKSRRVGAGLVIIRPTTHTRFYSIVNPLAAAISAGNCVILEVSMIPSFGNLLLTSNPAPRYPAAAGLRSAYTSHQSARPEHLLPVQHPRLRSGAPRGRRPSRPKNRWPSLNTHHTPPLLLRNPYGRHSGPHSKRRLGGESNHHRPLQLRGVFALCTRPGVSQ